MGAKKRDSSELEFEQFRRQLIEPVERLEATRNKIADPMKQVVDQVKQQVEQMERGVTQVKQSVEQMELGVDRFKQRVDVLREEVVEHEARRLKVDRTNLPEIIFRLSLERRKRWNKPIATLFRKPGAKARRPKSDAKAFRDIDDLIAKKQMTKSSAAAHVAKKLGEKPTNLYQRYLYSKNKG